jgi:hypothetical protein
MWMRSRGAEGALSQGWGHRGEPLRAGCQPDLDQDLAAHYGTTIMPARITWMPPIAGGASEATGSVQGLNPGAGGVAMRWARNHDRA